MTAQAEQAGWTVDNATRVFLEDLQSCLESTGHKLVAVLAGPDGSQVAELLATHPRVDAVHAFDADRADLHVAMTARAPFDLIVDDTGPVIGRADLFRSTFLHLRRGGVFLVRNAVTDAHHANDPIDGDQLADLFGVLTRGRLHKPAKRKERTGDDLLALAVGRLTIRGRHVLATNRLTARVKLREEDANELLRRRGDTTGRTLAVRPAAEFRSRATVRESDSLRAGRLPAAYHAPEVALRTYSAVTCAPGQVAWHGNVVLPDSFRHNQRLRMHNRYLDTLGPLFAQTPKPASPALRLDGAYFYLDSEFRGHFGHALTEQLSRLWPWREAHKIEPDLKALLLSNKRRELAQFEIDLYSAAGIPSDNIVFREDVVQVERLLAATPMFSQPHYVHPDLAALWREVSDNLASQAPQRQYPRRIFCARRGTKRACRNAAEVEQLFASHGFDVIYTEDYPLAEQARIFREAEVIGGFAGSALFNMCLSVEPKHVLMISSESYTAQNEYMMAAALGHQLDIAWCQPEIPLANAGFNREAFHSPFTFEMDREGRWVQRILSSLA